ncbi:MAG: rhodanese-like domain-containing protein [Planctomycetota bacterium]
MAYNLDDVKASLSSGSIILLDVRELDEWNAGHVKGARLVPLSDLSSGKIPGDLPKTASLYTYCRAGRRSVMGADILKAQGFNVSPLFEGFEELASKGFPRE